MEGFIMTDPRLEAVKLLMQIQKDSSYSSLAVSEALKEIHFSDPRDTAFAVSLVYGVLENKLTLDYNISLYLSDKSVRLKSNVRNTLRVGAYQILFLDKIPHSAAVNEAVKNTKSLGAKFATGMVNAILRRISENGLKLPETENLNKDLSIKYSVGIDIVDSLIKDYGIDKVQSIFSSFSGRRPIYIRHNTFRCSEEELTASLSKDGVFVNKTALDGCFSVENTGDMTSLDAFKRGYFYVQDMSSQLCCSLLDVKPGDFVVDCCAAPGGKSFTLSQYLENNGKLISCDIYPHKTALIEKSASRLGITALTTICCDARVLKDKFTEVDKVLCDVPCSGFGVIGRKPEIRYKRKEEYSSLPVLQKEILFSAADMVKKGGTLIYSTCTLNKAENEAVCDAFLRERPEFRISDDSKYKALTDTYLTLFPEKDGGDGFFVAKFIRG